MQPDPSRLDRMEQLALRPARRLLRVVDGAHCLACRKRLRDSDCVWVLGGTYHRRCAQFRSRRGRRG